MDKIVGIIMAIIAVLAICAVVIFGDVADGIQQGGQNVVNEITNTSTNSLP